MICSLSSVCVSEAGFCLNALVERVWCLMLHVSEPYSNIMCLQRGAALQGEGSSASMHVHAPA